MIAPSVAEIIRDHVQFFREHRGQPLPSAALMSPMSRAFVAALERFVTAHGIPLVVFLLRRRAKPRCVDGEGRCLIDSRQLDIHCVTSDSVQGAPN
jgi:hypothetical protein